MKTKSFRPLGLLVAIAILTALCCEISWAQDYRGRLQGIVTDTSEASVVGAKVTLLNEKTGAFATKETNQRGQYLFDFVEPGSYTLAVENPGFIKFTQQNVPMQVRGDVTVNAVLRVGQAGESITVSDTPPAVQFNTTTMELTVDRKMLTDLPVLARNPFSLALLNPAVVNTYGGERNPFYMWSSAGLSVGGTAIGGASGGSGGQNDLLLDGAPLMIANKGSYAPPMDAVQEFSVQQNSVDAEFGHTSGGVMSVAMKSGTNEFHGTAYYFGRNPMFNAVSNSITHSPNQQRNHIWGGTLGNPIRKNKLFTFTAFEQWRTKEPQSIVMTLPTALERTGDYSQSLNAAGKQRTIFDPWSTQFDPATGSVTRTPFSGNRIPTSRLDPTAQVFLKDIWLPNGPGDDVAGDDNYKQTYSRVTNYWNFSNRTDWNISDKLKIFGRYSQFTTHLGTDRLPDSPALPTMWGGDAEGGLMSSRNIAADMVYILDPKTVLNARFSYGMFNDDYDYPKSHLTASDYARFWPGNNWYQPYTKDLPALYYPYLNFGWNYALGIPWTWIQHPKEFTYDANIRRAEGPHNLKAGVEGRRQRNIGQYPWFSDFEFYPDMTADTFIAPNTGLRGDTWATFLLGALDNNSTMRDLSQQDISVNYYGGFVHDDISVTRRITLNLGLRYEYETAPADAKDRLSRYLDLTTPIAQMQNSPLQMPAQVQALRVAPPIYNGAWIFSDSQHRGMFQASKTNFLPRAGVAIRLNDKTALRIGYARYVVPAVMISGLMNQLNLPGFSAQTSVAPSLQGVPGAALSDPFPASNPLILPVGKAYGVNTNLGGSATWMDQEMHTGVNDRINFSLQRQLPYKVTIDATYFANLGHNLPYSKQLNLTDPQLSYTYKSALNAVVSNPFYQYSTPDQFPGSLRNQARVTVGSLLSPYPQYGALTQMNTNGIKDRYQALQLKLERPFSKGFFFLFGYSYSREKTYQFFNAIDQYADHFTYQDSANPRHRMTLAGTYELPVGRGRLILPNAHPIVNAILGGWATSSSLSINSGAFIRFPQLIVNGDPAVSDQTRLRYFNTSVFSAPLPYTPRTNPYQYPGVTGSPYWNLDSTLSKFFPIRDQVRLEFKMEAYNLTNSFVPGMPNMNVYSSLFGRSTTQANLGRQVQYTMRLHF